MRREIPALMVALLSVSVSGHAADYVSMSGEDLYKRFCAACHGAEGRGDGPVAEQLTVEVPDLTLLARRSRGVFPRERVARVIDGRHIFAAHGSRIMPVWGEDLSRLKLGDPDAERMSQSIIDKLVEYLERLQRPTRN